MATSISIPGSVPAGGEHWQQQLLARCVAPKRSHGLSRMSYIGKEMAFLESGLARTVAKDFLYLAIEAQCYRISISSILFFDEVLQYRPERSFDPLHPGRAVICKRQRPE